jgi:hypothetical protein
MALQQWQPPGWGMPFPAAPLQPRVRDRVRRQLVIGLAVGTLGFFLGLTRSGRGWLAIGLAWLLLGLLGAHRANGTRWLARMVAEYALVALLAVLVAGAFGVHPQPARPAGKAKADAAGELCPQLVQAFAGGICDRLDRAWQQAKRKTEQQQSTTPRK